MKSGSPVEDGRGGAPFRADRKGLGVVLQRPSPGELLDQPELLHCQSSAASWGPGSHPRSLGGGHLYSHCRTPVTSLRVEMAAESRSTLGTSLSRASTVNQFSWSSSEVSFIVRRLTLNRM